MIQQLSNQNNKLICQICSKILKNKKKLYFHRKYHCKSFKCKYCEKRFVLKSNRRVHERIHSGIKPYQCDWLDCQKKFRQKRSLKMHQKHVHKIGEISKNNPKKTI